MKLITDKDQISSSAIKVTKKILSEYSAFCFLLHPMSLNDAPISWRDVAKKYGLKFDPANWRYFQFPQSQEWPAGLEHATEGNLITPTLLALAKILTPYIKSPLYSSYDAMPAAHNAFDPSGPCLIISTVDEMINFVNRGRENQELFFSPSLSYPESLEWILWSEYDLDRTLVMGPQSLIDTLVASPDLEAYKTDEDTICRHYPILYA